MKVRFHPVAEEEFRSSVNWYDEHGDGLGRRFADAVVAKLNSLLANPNQGSKRWHSYHEILVDKTFPFLIVFLWVKERKEIFISAIFHTSRNPKRKYRSRNV